MLKNFILIFSIFTIFGTAFAGNIEIKQVPGQADHQAIEIHGVAAGEFDQALWESGNMFILPDARYPIIAPRVRGTYRNIYAPSIVETDDGWWVFYGAWDGVDTGNDRIYSLTTKDFLDFSQRQTVIEHYIFTHVCNVNALRLPDGSFTLMCTAYPDKDDLNKPALFTSPDGEIWNGSPAPYPAQMSDIIDIKGYDKYAEADINGVNAILYENGVYRLYFCNFKDYPGIFRATSLDAKTFTFDGVSLADRGMVNDVKKIVSCGRTTYLMAIHQNGDTIHYSLSTDGMSFSPKQVLAKNQDKMDRYIVAVGWVMQDNRVLGFLYGAGQVPGLNRNRIFARWLQKKVVFIPDDGQLIEPIAALGPDRQILEFPGDQPINGHFEVYAEDGTTRIAEYPLAVKQGRVYKINWQP